MRNQLKLSCSLLIAILFIGIYSTAGINVVGNGGGWAELQFITQFKNSDSTVTFLINQNWLVLKNYKSGLENLISDFKKQQQFEITFDSTMSADFVINESHLFVNNKVLYVDEGHPKKIHEIAILVIYAQLKMIGIEYAQEKFYQDFAAVFNHLKVEESGYISSFENSLLKINDLSYEFDLGTKVHLLAVEDMSHSYDITDLFPTQIPCGEISDWTFNQWGSEKHLNLRSFYSDASAACTGGIVYRLVIQFNIGETLLIDKKSIQVNIY